MSKSLKDFIKLLKEDWSVRGLPESVNDAPYMNLFRQEDGEGGWTWGGYDTFETLAECTKWAKVFIRENPNSKDEMLECVKVQDFLDAFAKSRKGA